MRQAVVDSVADGFAAGITGTPHTYVVAGNQQAVINGTRSFETMNNIVSSLLAQLDGTFEVDSSVTETVDNTLPVEPSTDSPATELVP